MRRKYFASSECRTFYKTIGLCSSKKDNIIKKKQDRQWNITQP